MQLIKKLAIGAILLAAGASAGRAAGPAPVRLIDFDQQFIGENASPLLDEDKKTPLTLRIVLVRALAHPMPGDETLPLEVKLKRGDLAIRILNAKAPMHLSVDEIAQIKQTVPKLWGNLIIAETWPMIDPDAARAP